MSREAGFTLVEMLVVLVAAGLLAALVAAGAGVWRGPSLDLEAARVTSALQLARAEAMARGRPVSVAFDGRSVAVAGLNWREALSAAALEADADRPLPALAFGPDGRADAPGLRLSAEGRERRIAIDILTGRAHVGP